MLAAGQGDGTVRVWHLAGSRPVGFETLKVGGEIIGTAFSPDGRRLAAASLIGLIDVWNVVGGRAVGPPRRLGSPMVRNLAFATDSRTLAAVGNDGSIRLWDSSAAKLAAPLVHVHGPLYGVAFRPGADELAAGGLSGQAWLWNRPGSSTHRRARRADTEPGLQRRRRSARAGPIRPDGLGPRSERKGGQRLARSHWRGHERGLQPVGPPARIGQHR
jgi:WD40 repeat protein